MNATTKRTYKIQAYPELIRCKYCEIDKKRQLYTFNKNGQIRSYCCKTCSGKQSLRPVHYYNNVAALKVLPPFPYNHSEYHKAMESMEHNPSFFRWLCSGENYYHKFVE